HCLHAREHRVAAIQVAPARLNHPHFWVGEKMDRSLEQVRLRDKVRVKDAEKFPIARIETDGQRASFESRSLHTPNQLDIETAPSQFLSAGGGNFARIVGRIV